MINQVMKWTIIIGLWRKYQRHLYMSIVVIVSLLIVSLLHQDFIEFAQQSNSPYLGLSYAIKWGVYLLIAAGYVVVIKKINKGARTDSQLHQMMKQSEKTKTKQENADSSLDPFANIRDKKTLRSKADFVIQKQQEEDQ